MSKLGLNLTPKSMVLACSLKEEYDFMLRFQSKAGDKSEETAGVWVQGWREGSSLAPCSCFWVQKDFWGLSKVNNLLPAVFIDRGEKGEITHTKKPGAFARHVFRRKGLEAWGQQCCDPLPDFSRDLERREWSVPYRESHEPWHRRRAEWRALVVYKQNQAYAHMHHRGMMCQLMKSQKSSELL